MSGVKGNCGGGGGQVQGGGDCCGKVDTYQDPCNPINPCQNVTPAPAQCKEIVDPCQENQTGGIGGVYGGVIGGQGGQGSQVSYGGGVVKK